MKSKNPLLYETAERSQSSMPESLWPRFPTVPVSRISIKPKESRNHKTVSQPCLGYNLKWESHRDFFYITTKPEGRLFSLRRSIFKWPTCGFRDITQKKSFTSSSCLITVQILFRSLQLQWKNTTGVVESYLSPGAEWHSIFKQQLLTVMSDGRKLLGGLAEY